MRGYPARALATFFLPHGQIQRVVVGVALLWVSLPACSGIPFFYSAEAIEGRVTDADTGKPLEGVILVAHWQLQGGFEGGTPIKELQIAEAVTDRDGRYSFPGWGPRFAASGHLKSESPEILLFKPGYKFRALSNNWYPGKDLSKSDWKGQTVKLERFAGTLKEYAQHIWSFSDTLWVAGYAVGDRSGDPCGWKSFPNMLRAMDKLDEELKPLRMMDRTVAARLRDADSQLRAAGCGTVKDLIGK